MDPDISDAIASLLFRPHEKEQSEEHLRQAIRVYDMTVSEHDKRDIFAAVRRFIRGEVAGHNKAFPPTPAELGAEIISERNKRLESERRCVLALSAPSEPVVTDEERARMLAMADAYVRDHKSRARFGVAQIFASTNARFMPDQSEPAIRQRLKLDVGDADGRDD